MLRTITFLDRTDLLACSLLYLIFCCLLIAAGAGGVPVIITFWFGWLFRKVCQIVAVFMHLNGEVIRSVVRF